MKILAFDLELNQDPSGPKIIEVGACVGDINTGEVIDRYDAFVNPQQKLVEMIIKLTSITQQQVDEAGSLLEAYRGLEAFAIRHDCLRMPIVWGIGDGHALRQELPADVPWLFGRRELDVKAVFQAYQMAINGKIQAGLSKSMSQLGLSFIGKKHRAIDDAVNTFLIYCALLAKFSRE